MTRKHLLAVIVTVAALAGGAWWLRPSARPARASLPFAVTAGQNILLITVDTLRADALGGYGGAAATPNLDRLARDGARFSFAHAHAVMTLPSHASILTGLYPFRHGVRDNAGYRLDDSATTLAELAKGAGLATGAFVGAFPLDRQFGLHQGFDVYDDVGGLGIAEAEFAMAERRAEAVVSAARAWIGKQTTPWFSWVHVFDPHAPYSAPAPFNQQYAQNAYAGEVAYVDHALGPLLDEARRSSRPTLVIVTSDHGEGLGDHGEITHGTFAYESTLKVPLIVAQVDAQGARGAIGQTIDEPVHHVDVFTTVVEALGLAFPQSTDGQRSLVGDLRGQAAQRPLRASYFEAMSPMLTRGWAPLRGIMVEREKYLDLPIEELYDLQTDPKEERNAAAGSARARDLFDALRKMNAAMPGEQRSESSESRERLSALGYVSGSAPRKDRYTAADDPKTLIGLDRLMLEGIDLFARGRAADAIAAYRKVTESRPSMSVAWRRLAFMQWEVGDVRGAIDTLRASLKIQRDVETEVRLATYLSETGDASQAIGMLERITSADTRNTEALNALGIAYARAGRNDAALKTFERILAINARDVHAHENIGTVHLGRGDVTAAAAAFTRALQLAPSSSRAHAGLGVVALDGGRRDEAITHWRRAVELDRRNFDALFNLATELLNARRTAEARPYVELFVRTAPRAFYGRDIDRLAPLLR